MLRYLGPIVATALVILILFAASVPLMYWFAAEGRQADLDEGRELWASHGITGYEFTVRVEPAGGEASTYTFEVSPNGVVETRERAGLDDMPVDTPDTVRALFRRVSDAIASAPDYMSVTYDEDYGYPRSIEVDPDDDRDGDEDRIEVTYFRPLAADR